MSYTNCLLEFRRVSHLGGFNNRQSFDRLYINCLLEFQRNLSNDTLFYAENIGIDFFTNLSLELNFFSYLKLPFSFPPSKFPLGNFVLRVQKFKLVSSIYCPNIP